MKPNRTQLAAGIALILAAFPAGGIAALITCSAATPPNQIGPNATFALLGSALGLAIFGLTMWLGVMMLRDKHQ